MHSVSIQRKQLSGWQHLLTLSPLSQEDVRKAFADVFECPESSIYIVSHDSRVSDIYDLEFPDDTLFACVLEKLDREFSTSLLSVPLSEKTEKDSDLLEDLDSEDIVMLLASYWHSEGHWGNKCLIASPVDDLLDNKEVDNYSLLIDHLSNVERVWLDQNGENISQRSNKFEEEQTYEIDIYISKKIEIKELCRVVAAAFSIQDSDSFLCKDNGDVRPETNTLSAKNILTVFEIDRKISGDFCLCLTMSTTDSDSQKIIDNRDDFFLAIKQICDAFNCSCMIDEYVVDLKNYKAELEFLYDNKFVLFENDDIYRVSLDEEKLESSSLENVLHFLTDSRDKYEPYSQAFLDECLK